MAKFEKAMEPSGHTERVDHSFLLSLYLCLSIFKNDPNPGLFLFIFGSAQLN